MVRPRPGLRVLAPSYQAPGCVVYPLLEGQPLSRRTVFKFAKPAQRRIARQLGGFLFRLHTTLLADLYWPLSATLAPVRRADWLELQANANQKIAPLLQAYQLGWLADLFEHILQDPLADRYAPALIHGDPASDIGGLISIYGETLVQKMKLVYPGLERFQPRARFYAQLLEIQWVLNGLESGETFWFTAHLGNARDIY